MTVLTVKQVFLVLLQSQHENMKVNDHDDQTSSKELCEWSLRRQSFQYGYAVKLHNSTLHDDQNDAILFPDFHERKMPLPHSINFGI